MASKSQASSKADNKTQVLKSDSSEETSLKSVTVPANKEEDDPELNALLDSALEDFDNQPKHSQPLSADLSKADDAVQGKKEPSGSVPAAELLEQQETLFNELFGSESSEDGGGNKEFEETMKRFMQQDPDMLSQFQKISQLAGNAEGGDREGREQEFADTLAQTLSGLAQNAQGLQDQMSEDDLIRALGGLGMGGESGDGPEADIMPMMQGMMKNLLSKDVLYPSLKEISEKYPKWLEGNKDKTEAAEYENYQKQYHLMDHICQQFEAEDSKEPENVKNERFEKILDLMQQMQELGHPPKEIVGEMAPGLEFDENGLPKVGGSQQCSVM